MFFKNPGHIETFKNIKNLIDGNTVKKQWNCKWIFCDDSQIFTKSLIFKGWNEENTETTGKSINYLLLKIKANYISKSAIDIKVSIKSIF